MADIVIREMSIEDYDKVIELWSGMAGVGLSAADSRENVARMLQRNAGFSFVAVRAGREVVGALLGGHDGRRGCLYHLAVRGDCRRAGIGRALAESCFERFKAAGIGKCHLFVFPDNQAGMRFWQNLGLTKREDLIFYSKDMA